MRQVLPKIIHQLWIGEGSPPPEVVESMDLWRFLHPEFEHRLWTLDDVAPHLMRLVDLPVMDCVLACRFPAMQSDIIRYALLYLFGGVWTDLKNRPLKRFLHLFPELGLTAAVEHPPTLARPDPTGFIYNSFMMAPPHDPYMRLFLRHACEWVQARKEVGGVYTATGGSMMMRAMKRSPRLQSRRTLHAFPWRLTWGVLMQRITASYNHDGHWSELQRTQSLYLERLTETPDFGN